MRFELTSSGLPYRTLYRWASFKLLHFICDHIWYLAPRGEPVLWWLTLNYDNNLISRWSHLHVLSIANTGDVVNSFSPVTGDLAFHFGNFLPGGAPPDSTEDLTAKGYLTSFRSGLIGVEAHFRYAAFCKASLTLSIKIGTDQSFICTRQPPSLPVPCLASSYSPSLLYGLAQSYL